MLPSVPPNKSGPRLDTGIETALKTPQGLHWKPTLPWLLGLKTLELIPLRLCSGRWGGLPRKVEVKTPESFHRLRGP